MAHYRKIDSRIWNDRKFRELDAYGKMAFFILLTHPHMTALGAMRASVEGLVAECGSWADFKALREGFGEVFLEGMAKADEIACLVWLPNFMKYNPPESPNVVKAWAKAADLLPECGLKDQVIAGAKAFAEGLPEGFRKALPEFFAKGMPNQEQEQEQEQRESSSLRSEDSCPEPAQAADSRPQPVLTYPTRGKAKTWDLTEAVIAEMAELYDGVDVLAECKRALAWVKANPDRRKTARGMRRFLNGWIDRSVNRGNAKKWLNGQPEAPISGDQRAAVLSRNIQDEALRRLDAGEIDDKTYESIGEAASRADQANDRVTALERIREEYGF